MDTLDDIYHAWRGELLKPVDQINIDRIAELETAAYSRGASLVQILASGALVAAPWDADRHPRGKDGKFIELMGWVNLTTGSGNQDRRGQVTDISPDPANPGKPKITVELEGENGVPKRKIVVTPDKILSAPKQKARLDAPDAPVIDDGKVDPPSWAADIWDGDPNNPDLIDGYMEHEMGFNPKTMRNLDERVWEEADARMQDEIALWRDPPDVEEEDTSSDGGVEWSEAAGAWLDQDGNEATRDQIENAGFDPDTDPDGNDLGSDDEPVPSPPPSKLDQLGTNPDGNPAVDKYRDKYLNGLDDYGKTAAKGLSDDELDQVIAWREDRNSSNDAGLSGTRDLQILNAERDRRKSASEPSKSSKPTPAPSFAPDAIDDPDAQADELGADLESLLYGGGESFSDDDVEKLQGALDEFDMAVQDDDLGAADSALENFVNVLNEVAADLAPGDEGNRASLEAIRDKASDFRGSGAYEASYDPGYTPGASLAPMPAPAMPSTPKPKTDIGSDFAGTPQPRTVDPALQKLADQSSGGAKPGGALNMWYLEQRKPGVADSFGKQQLKILSDSELDDAIAERKSLNDSGKMGMSGGIDLKTLQAEKTRRSSPANPAVKKPETPPLKSEWGPAEPYAAVSKKLSDAGAKWNSNLKLYEMPDGSKIREDRNPDNTVRYSVYPPGVSYWSTDATKVKRFGSIDEALTTAPDTPAADAAFNETSPAASVIPRPISIDSRGPNAYYNLPVADEDLKPGRKVFIPATADPNGGNLTAGGEMTVKALNPDGTVLISSTVQDDFSVPRDRVRYTKSDVTASADAPSAGSAKTGFEQHTDGQLGDVVSYSPTDKTALDETMKRPDTSKVMRKVKDDSLAKIAASDHPAASAAQTEIDRRASGTPLADAVQMKGGKIVGPGVGPEGQTNPDALAKASDDVLKSMFTSLQNGPDNENARRQGDAVVAEMAKRGLADPSAPTDTPEGDFKPRDWATTWKNAAELDEHLASLSPDQRMKEFEENIKNPRAPKPASRLKKMSDEDLQATYAVTTSDVDLNREFKIELSRRGLYETPGDGKNDLPASLKKDVEAKVADAPKADASKAAQLSTAARDANRKELDNWIAVANKGYSPSWKNRAHILDKLRDQNTEAANNLRALAADAKAAKNTQLSRAYNDLAKSHDALASAWNDKAIGGSQRSIGNFEISMDTMEKRRKILDALTTPTSAPKPAAPAKAPTLDDPEIKKKLANVEMMFNEEGINYTPKSLFESRGRKYIAGEVQYSRAEGSSTITVKVPSGSEVEIPLDVAEALLAGLPAGT